MAILLRVKWVEQSDHPDVCQRIMHVGGNSGQIRWKHSHAEAIESLEKGLFSYYLEKDARILSLNIGLAPTGQKFLKTVADKEHPQNLLSLPGTAEQAVP